MATKNNETKNKPFAGLFTALSVILFLGGFYLVDSTVLLNMANRPWYLRLLLLLITVGLSVLALRMTAHWNYLIDLIKGARIEIHKVTPPKKDDWVKSTLMVLLVVAIFAIFLSIIDLLLAGIINWML